ncbi:MAG: hypothetical protein HYX24_03130 [Candidatus Aenigmarchaeota archaeon]|nr:hypothetical protein [Candidatus Aenigmarchaeota archaeon]
MEESNVPEISIGWSPALQLYILKSRYDEKRLDRFCQKFEEYWGSYKGKILAEIVKCTGYEWKTRKLEVFIFEGYNESIPAPLLINIYDEDKDFVLFQLIRMLIHNIFLDNNIYTFFSKDEAGRVEIEAVIYLSAKRISASILPEKEVKRLCKKAEFGGWQKYIWERVREVGKKWDISKKNLKEWLIEKG